MMKQHYVEFYSPGTIVAESSRKEIDSWDVDKAVTMADEIVERHGATPWGFQFLTRERGEHDLDARETDRSAMHHLGGKIMTIDDVEKRADPKDKILLMNMKSHTPKIVENRNSWKSCNPFKEGDILLDYTPPRRKEAK